jgi:fructose-1,6-bisphosphatase/inositol monophosphatase family enzyme
VIDEVVALLRDVAARVVMPRYRNLAREEISSKAPGDPVTVADREAESLIGAGLVELRPGSTVVGEEAVAGDPSLVGRLREPGEVWVIDPIDGTANFAAGREPFAIMVALVHDGVTVASWILDPVAGTIGTAERGAGAYLDGVRVRTPAGHRPAYELTGPAGAPISPAGGGAPKVIGGHNCVGYEYPAIVRDEQQFALFGRTLPWDHAPGVLFLEEAGGVAWRLDGTPYRPGDDQTGLLVAQNQATWDTVRSTLLTRS